MATPRFTITNISGDTLRIAGRNVANGASISLSTNAFGLRLDALRAQLAASDITITSPYNVSVGLANLDEHAFNPGASTVKTCLTTTPLQANETEMLVLDDSGHVAAQVLAAGLAAVPDWPRNIEVVVEAWAPAGDDDDEQTDIDIVIVGTDMWGVSRTETIALTGADTFVGQVPFSTIVSIDYDELLAGTSLTIQLGTILGLPFHLLAPDGGAIKRTVLKNGVPLDMTTEGSCVTFDDDVDDDNGNLYDISTFDLADVGGITDDDVFIIIGVEDWSHEYTLA